MTSESEPIEVEGATAEHQPGSGYKLVTRSGAGATALSNAAASGSLVSVEGCTFRVTGPAVGVWWGGVQSGPETFSFKAELVNESLERRLLEVLKRKMWRPDGPDTLTVRAAIELGSHALRTGRYDVLAALKELWRFPHLRFVHRGVPNWDLDSDDQFFVIENYTGGSY